MWEYGQDGLDVKRERLVHPVTEVLDEQVEYGSVGQGGLQTVLASALVPCPPRKLHPHAHAHPLPRHIVILRPRRSAHGIKKRDPKPKGSIFKRIKVSMYEPNIRNAKKKGTYTTNTTTVAIVACTHLRPAK